MHLEGLIEDKFLLGRHYSGNWIHIQCCPWKDDKLHSCWTQKLLIASFDSFSYKNSKLDQTNPSDISRNLLKSPKIPHEKKSSQWSGPYFYPGHTRKTLSQESGLITKRYVGYWTVQTHHVDKGAGAWAYPNLNKIRAPCMHQRS